MISTHCKRKNPTTISSSSSANNTDNINNYKDLKRPKTEMMIGNNNNDDFTGSQNLNYDEEVSVALPVGFLDPLSPSEREHLNACVNNAVVVGGAVGVNIETPVARPLSGTGTRKQFWQAGDYKASHAPTSSSYSGGLDHVRVHPKFLHSNATSHKWALGAFAELLDNALDEVYNGATYVRVDMLLNEKKQNKSLADKDRSRMLLVQEYAKKLATLMNGTSIADNGGGMNPDKMRQCVSLGYSAKSNIANTIGQYGNGFKTSTMRLGADVIVFSICQGKDGTCATRSIGLLSYTFLTSTGKEDIVVPMVDYEKRGEVWTKMVRSSLNDWHLNLDTITQWSPFSSEQELLQQFNSICDQGTKIVIYNLWEDDEGLLELDFDTYSDDIQIRGANRDEKKIAMARKYPNSKHFLTYQHSLRSYVSILYLRLPPGFRIILRGKDVVHHNLVNDMIHPKSVSYKPVAITDGTVKESKATSENMQALVTMGFVKDAEDHIDIQGFNVYHKNRLIKPFWRVWNAAGSDGRGVIGVLEANFVEPAHDKQGFERTTALSRLESRLIHLQKTYWRDNCHEIGYAPRRSVYKAVAATPLSSIGNGNTIKGIISNISDDSTWKNSVKKSDNGLPFVESSSEDENYDSPPPGNQSHTASCSKVNGKLHTSPEIKGEIAKLKRENLDLKRRLEHANESKDSSLRELQLERHRCTALEAELEEANQKNEENNKEMDAVIQTFQEERERRDVEEENLRKLVQDASKTIDQLVNKVKALERMKHPTICKPEKE